MALITRTYTFTDGTTAYGSQVDSEIANIVNTMNSLDQGNTTWTNVKVTTLLPQADVNAGGHKVTNLGTAVNAGDAIGAGMSQVISTGMLVPKAVTSSTIADGTITTTQISSSAAITKAQLSLVTGDITQVQSSTNTSSSHGTDITTVTITTTGGKVLLIGCANINIVASGGLAGTSLEVTQGNTAIVGGHTIMSGTFAVGGATIQLTLPMAVIDTPVAGTYTYKLSYVIQNGTFSSLSGYSLQAVELKA